MKSPAQALPMLREPMAQPATAGGGDPCAGGATGSCACRDERRLSPNGPPLLRPEERVLATLDADGKRRWLTPRLARGAWWRRRLVVAYGLIALFVALPWLRIGGLPVMLLDVPAREFTLFGKVFYPTDTLLLALLMLGVFLSIFFATAVLGRAWCGWACPQTVYLEFVFRPIERLFLGTAGRGGKPKPVGAWRKPAMFLAFAAFSFFIANTFLAYFVGTDRLTTWVVGSPFDHPFGFGLVLVVTAAMLFNFAFFREQLCHIACPYGRFQSVMLDRRSLIVSYDHQRGEPRGKGKKTDQKGDCVDCSLCVQVCPMGIDIRDGLQMECVHCTQCIDACDGVMTKLGRDTGLVGYASVARREGEVRHGFRPRIVLYPAALLTLATLFLVVLGGKGDFDVTLLRGKGQPFSLLDDGRVRNSVAVKIVNRSGEPRTYAVAADDPAIALDLAGDFGTVAPGEVVTRTVHVVADRAKLGRHELVITDSSGHVERRLTRLVGPIAIGDH